MQGFKPITMIFDAPPCEVIYLPERAAAKMQTRGRLEAVGVPIEQSDDYIRMFCKLSRFAGKPVDRLIRIYLQIRCYGYAPKEEIMALIDYGIPVLGRLTPYEMCLFFDNGRMEISALNSALFGCARMAVPE